MVSLGGLPFSERRGGGGGEGGDGVGQCRVGLEEEGAENRSQDVICKRLMKQSLKMKLKKLAVFLILKFLLFSNFVFSWYYIESRALDYYSSTL